MTLEESLCRRAQLLKALKDDSQRQAREYELCARDPVYWLSRWGWLEEPRNAGAGLPVHMPFDLFPRQAELLEWLLERERHQESGVIEKSRDVGATWLCAAYALHGWLFLEGYAVGFGSRKLELVDARGDPKCIFHKLRYLLGHLPWWMKPPHFDRRNHDNEARLINPDNGSSIVGEGGDEIGRGARTAIYFVDEAAHLERPKLVDAALSATTRVRIDVSTPCGQGNPFWQKRFSGTMPVFSFHWRQDPRKDDAWYQQEKRRLIDPALVAQELDLDYSASVPDIAIPARWVRAAVGLQLPATGPILAGLDIGWEQGNTVLTPRQGPVVQMPVAWTGQDTWEGARRAGEETRRAGARLLYYDACGVGMDFSAAFRKSERQLGFTPVGVNSGQSPTGRVWPDGMTSREKFRNLRAEMWWTLRVRFERTWEYVEQGIPHPVEDLISLPLCPELIAQLSLPTYYRLESGKVGIEKKEDLKRRGIRSPDYADSLALAYAPIAPPAPAAAGGVAVIGQPGPVPEGFAAATARRPTPAPAAAPAAAGGLPFLGHFGPRP